MHQTIEYGYWSVAEWVAHGSAHAATVEEELLEGLRAYAAEQESRELQTCVHLKVKWARIQAKGAAYLAGEMVLSVEVVVDMEEGESDGEDEEDGLGFEDDEDEEEYE
ncbi:hypothetical protein B0H14DRAFT_2640194 [Mycena olivaceomarginata]|nr:hypothetical protein B0H14DRAFT_2640194 [Mycena olivaceomarginata]